TGKRLTTADMARGLAADGLSGVLGGVMNAFLDTVFAQNVGLVTMTKVRSRHVATVAGGILVLLGLVPRLGALVAGLPQPVVGAAGLVMFATVAAVGVGTLRKVDFDGTHNLLIVAVSIGVGMAPEVAPDLYSRLPDGIGIVLGSPVTSATLLAFFLNLAFNGGTSLRDPGLVRAPAPEGKGRDAGGADGTPAAEPDGLVHGKR
ncbi:solute carrier family 23 protein, partial [Streptomyces hydrogenans]